MSVVRVYRPERDWKGQRPKDFESSYIGTVTGVIVGGAAPQPLARFPGTMTTEGQFGFPYEQESGILVQPQDLLVLRGEKYIVTGPRQWEEEHEFAGPAGDIVNDYYWMEVRAS